jgi:hypothetical protein
MTRVIVTLRNDEREALTRLALAEYRTPRDQARYILRQELERRGLLANTATTSGRGESHEQ